MKKEKLILKFVSYGGEYDAKIKVDDLTAAHILFDMWRDDELDIGKEDMLISVTVEDKDGNVVATLWDKDGYVIN